MDFCEEYDDESGKCKKCEKYFYLDDDFSCVYINIPFCRKLDENKECKDWAGFYEHDDDVHKAKEKYETGCERWNEEGTCTVCNYPFILNSETKTCSMNCEEYSEPLCEYCEHGYILLQTDKDGTFCYPVLDNTIEEEKEEEKEEESENAEESEESKENEEKKDIKEKESNQSEESGNKGNTDKINESTEKKEKENSDNMDESKNSDNLDESKNSDNSIESKPEKSNNSKKINAQINLIILILLFLL